MSKFKSYINENGDAKELDKHFFKTATRGRPPLPQMKRKQRVTIMLDPDILYSLKAEGKGWQTRLNATLREALGL